MLPDGLDMQTLIRVVEAFNDWDVNSEDRLITELVIRLYCILVNP